MSSGVFRDKESSNRIELSRLVQDLLNFGVLGSLRPWGLGVGVWGWGVVGGAPHTCAHAHTHIYTLNMIISIANGSPHWGNPWESPMMSYTRARACVHVCACAHGGGAPSHHPPPPSTHPPPPKGDPWNHSKFSST